jgi:hypothetical protein
MELVSVQGHRLQQLTTVLCAVTACLSLHRKQNRSQICLVSKTPVSSGCSIRTVAKPFVIGSVLVRTALLYPQKRRGASGQACSLTDDSERVVQYNRGCLVSQWHQGSTGRAGSFMGWPRQTTERFLQFLKQPGRLLCFVERVAGLARKKFCHWLKSPSGSD